MSTEEKSKTPLAPLMEVVVRSWGWKAVIEELQRIYVSDFEVASNELQELKPRRADTRKPKNAVQQVNDIEVAGERKSILLAIAAKFEERAFLPSLSSIREFLAMRGLVGFSFRDRSTGFRLLLDVLKEAPLDDLRDLLGSAAFSGPSRLAPLAEAIRAAGRARRDEARNLDDTEHASNRVIKNENED
ncbi:hypothetical protein [Bradyrhizobium sp. HKCCYLS3013]|uniref:hypothetical protein n=1 Tax=Bradyrhizobium sp. HKCCYLS3013 TaxID=3420735 RepID=UPI003EC0BF98